MVSFLSFSFGELHHDKDETPCLVLQCLKITFARAPSSKADSLAAELNDIADVEALGLLVLACLHPATVRHARALF